ncbi:MbcA/ParS/Xre antitoxin family protein [Jannaschia sp. M317]|uniref:MbcA/ParS/Xre antitoxin family protein n=1 Tax=Jannaschia sp. M317 TaxID=2867011 RepID=UPI0021A8EB8A|nr:MbcA/ParS/Xre antitoxin family protein [Jannaschia sp. M317]UWQ16908.1 MbcA/ParS/Xre antitoxin family protein [Jannaschia sp. M317]
MLAPHQPATLPHPSLPSRADRARISGPGLRAFSALADTWILTERERIAVLGDPGRSTYHQWMKKARDGLPVTLPLDTLLRISAMLGVHKALAILFSDPAQAMTWLNGAHTGTVFHGAAPRRFITDGALDGIMTVRRYLDAWRGGSMGHGAPEGAWQPVTPGDLVFV